MRFIMRRSYKVLLLLGVLFLYILNIYFDYQVSLHNQIPQNSFKLSYDIKTSQCAIPHLDPFDPQFKIFTRKIKNPCKMYEPLVTSNVTHLKVNKGALQFYNASDKMYCTVRQFWRHDPKRRQPDKITYFSFTSYNFTDEFRVDFEYVIVRCYEGTNPEGIYKDFFSFVPVPRKEYINMNPPPENINVMIFGLDSMSRAQFLRQLPETRNFLLNDLEAIEYFGFHRVGDNTFPNLIPVLTGQDVDELQKDCWPNKFSRFDKCKFIWQKFHDKGYASAFAEEESWMGLFHYQKKGFNKQPTTHFWLPFSLEIGWNLGKRVYNTRVCLNERPAPEYLVNYTTKFARSYQESGLNFFGLFWECSMSHDSNMFYPGYDPLHRNMLQELNKTGILNNTILFFMSDHGYRYGKILQTYKGRFEQNLPFLYVVLPKWFKKAYPTATRNIKENARKLTSHFDLHETLQAIVDHKFSPDLKMTRGISIFQPIPEMRTCSDAGIKTHFCNCQHRSYIDVKDVTVIIVANFIVRHINSLLASESQCAVLKLEEIKDARTFHVQDVNYFTVVFSVKPSNAIFEATVACVECVDKSDFKLDGPITRSNLYGHQADCIHDSFLRLYCFCKNQT